MRSSSRSWYYAIAQVRVFSFRSHDNKTSILSKTAIVLLPSFHELLGLVVGIKTQVTLPNGFTTSLVESRIALL